MIAITLNCFINDFELKKFIFFKAMKMHISVIGQDIYPEWLHMGI